MDGAGDAGAGGSGAVDAGAGDAGVDVSLTSANTSAQSVVDVLNDDTAEIDVVGDGHSHAGLEAPRAAGAGARALAAGNGGRSPSADDIALASGLTSLHAQVTSPITAAAAEVPFLDVVGDADLRGSGTPPGTSLGPHGFSQPSESSPLLAPSSGAARGAPALSWGALATAEHRQYDSVSGRGAGKGELHISIVEPGSGNGNGDGAGNGNGNGSSGAPSSSESRDSRRLRARTKRADSARELRKAELERRQWIWACTALSLVANVCLFTFKVYVSVTSRSLAVMASAVDSFLDLVSQTIIYYALRGTRVVDEERYPVGRNRLEPIGIIVCASLMGIAALQLVLESLRTLVNGTLHGADPASLVPSVDAFTVELLGSAIVIKLALFVLCRSMRDESDSMMVLAEDHRNDILSNAIALATALGSNRYPPMWWLDPLGGILIAVYICVVWLIVAMEQAAMLEGVAAEPVFLEQVKLLADSFHESMYVDVVRAYHFGKRYLVEVEVVLPGDMVVVQAHDISLDLQKKIERLERVERAFVHVDYMTRDENEHKAAFDPTPPSSPAYDDGGMSDEESETSSIDINLEEEVQVFGDVYQNHGHGTHGAHDGTHGTHESHVGGPQRTVRRHIHATHHQHRSSRHARERRDNREMAMATGSPLRTALAQQLALDARSQAETTASIAGSAAGANTSNTAKPLE